MKAAAREETRLYKDACEDLRASITPLVCTVDGESDRELIPFKKE